MALASLPAARAPTEFVDFSIIMLLISVLSTIPRTSLPSAEGATT